MLSTRLLIAFTAVLLLGCSGGSTATLTAPDIPEGAESNGAEPVRRFVTGGWVSPYGEKAGPFSNELRAFIITDQAQLDSYFNGFATICSQGTTSSPGRVDFPNSILLAAYYRWRPLQGDTLSFVGLSLEGNQAIVQMEFIESPQGKEYPYLFAPMEVVTVERSAFPASQPIEFVFQVSGEPMAQVVATVN